MKGRILFALRFLVSFGILFYLVRLIPMGKIMAAISSVHVGLVILSIVLAQVTNYLSAVKAKILTDELDMSLTVRKIFEINYVTQFYGLFLPEVISSGVIRWHKLSRPDRKPAEALASMIFNRFTEVMFVAGLGVLFWSVDDPPRLYDFVGPALAVLVLVGAISYFVIFSRNLSLFLLEKINRARFVPRSILEKANKLLMATSHYRSLNRWSLVRLVGLNLSKDMIGILGFFLVARSVDIDVRFVTIGWMRSCVHLLAMLPISVSGLGIQEGSLIFLLGSYGISSAAAVVLSFLLHVRTLVGGAIGGLIQAVHLLFPDPKRHGWDKVS